MSTLIDHPPNKSGVVSIIVQYILHSGEYAFALWDLVQFKSPKGQGQGSRLKLIHENFLFWDCLHAGVVADGS